MSQKMTPEQQAKVAEFQRLQAELLGMGLQPAQVAMAPAPSPAPPAAPQAATQAPTTSKSTTGATIPKKKETSKPKTGKSSKSLSSKAKQVATQGPGLLDPPTPGIPAGRTPAHEERSRPLYVPSNPNATTAGVLTTPPAREAKTGTQTSHGRARTLSGPRSPPASQHEPSRGRTQGLAPARMGPPRTRSKERYPPRQGGVWNQPLDHP